MENFFVKETTWVRILKFSRYEVYRGYIVFAFSVIMFVCLSVCLSLNFFFVKDFSATTWVRILKFDTRLDSDELYCATKEQPHIAYQSLYLFIFFLSNGNFCHRFLSCYWRHCFQILCTPSGWQSVLCKWKLRSYPHFAFFFQIFIFSFFLSYMIHMDIFPVKDFSTTT